MNVGAKRNTFVLNLSGSHCCYFIICTRLCKPRGSLGELLRRFKPPTFETLAVSADLLSRSFKLLIGLHKPVQTREASFFLKRCRDYVTQKFIDISLCVKQIDYFFRVCADRS